MVVLNRSQQGMSRFGGDRAIFDAERRFGEYEVDTQALDEGCNNRL
jgi:hypothetical protein